MGAVIVINVVIRRLVIAPEVPAVDIINEAVVVVIFAVVGDLSGVCPDRVDQIWVGDLDTCVNLQQQWRVSVPS
jgi:hypothetical protein